MDLIGEYVLCEALADLITSAKEVFALRKCVNKIFTGESSILVAQGEERRILEVVGELEEDLIVAGEQSEELCEFFGFLPTLE